MLNSSSSPVMSAPSFPLSVINPFVHLFNQIVLSRKVPVPMKQHSPLSLPHPQQILACAHNPGVLLNTFQLPTGCFTTLVCLKPGGFKAGTSLELPDAWWRFAKESSHSANIVQSKVIADIECGAEIVVCQTPENRKSEPEEPIIVEIGTRGLLRNAIDCVSTFFTSTRIIVRMFAPCARSRSVSQVASTSIYVFTPVNDRTSVTFVLKPSQHLQFFAHI
uniref:Uncharacterized protein n=1 Tax=Caenorhabditis japonica TaxID=281687 RepID=A0A8R1HSK0_CAEJA